MSTLERLDTLGHALRLPAWLMRPVCDRYDARLLREEAACRWREGAGKPLSDEQMLAAFEQAFRERRRS
jgi:hypothetical protein